MFSYALDLTGAPLCQLELTVALRDRGSIEPCVVSAQDGPLRRRYEQHGIPVRIQPEIAANRSTDEYDAAVSAAMREVTDAGAESSTATR